MTDSANLLTKSSKSPSLPSLSNNHAVYSVTSSVTEPSLSVTNPSPKIEKNKLVFANGKDERKSLMIESKAAKIIAQSLKGYFAYNAEICCWHSFTGACWKPLENESSLESVLCSLLEIATADIGYRPSYMNGIIKLIKAGNELPLPKADSNKLPFTNGLLDLNNRKLEKITPDNALIWCLPYEYKNSATCPNIESWLLDATVDEEALEYLKVFMAASLRGTKGIQKFLHLKGFGGTGKSTFVRLLEKLVGKHNIVTTDIRKLEEDKFETASLYGKRLVVISEAGKYGGSVNVFKAVTGGDPISFERKHQQKGIHFVFEGLCIIVSNDYIRTTDYTSGIERRRATVEFNKVVTDEQKRDWDARGGEEGVLHSELPGLVNWLLSFTESQIKEIIDNPPFSVLRSNQEAAKENNPIAQWIDECCYFENKAETYLGGKAVLRSVSGATIYENSDEQLYPNYCQWCDSNGHKPIATNRFRETLLDCCNNVIRQKITSKKANKGQVIQGLALKPLNDFF